MARQLRLAVDQHHQEEVVLSPGDLPQPAAAPGAHLPTTPKPQALQVLIMHHLCNACRFTMHLNMYC